MKILRLYRCLFNRKLRTLARWLVTTPQEIVEHMLDLVKDDTTTTSLVATTGEKDQTLFSSSSVLSFYY
jgi:hypothetical protein